VLERTVKGNFTVGKGTSSHLDEEIRPQEKAPILVYLHLSIRRVETEVSMEPGMRNSDIRRKKNPRKLTNTIDQLKTWNMIK
jgi:hypothetical protein